MTEKVVVQFGNRIVKGQTIQTEWKPDAANLLHSLPIQVEGSGSFTDLPLEGVKAIFFVKSFEGKFHEDLRFHDHLPSSDCLWVRIVFKDDEIIEGLILNSHEFVLNQGFLLSPIDSDGNNWLVYTLKSQLKDFCVLGLRPAHKSLPDLRLNRSKS